MFAFGRPAMISASACFCIFKAAFGSILTWRRQAVMQDSGTVIEYTVFISESSSDKEDFL